MEMENDQAERLRETAADLKIDKNSPLPSRKEVHGKKRQGRPQSEEEERKIELKTSFWWTRFLLAVFIILITFMLTYHFWYDRVFYPVHSEITNDIERVDIER
jgi:hypothetical protein